MKRILTLVWLTAILVCCDVGPRQTNAKSSKSVYIGTPNYEKVYVTTEKIDDIEYKIFSMYRGGLHVVNHTKELLEVELIQKQIDEIDKRNQE